VEEERESSGGGRDGERERETRLGVMHETLLKWKGRDLLAGQIYLIKRETRPPKAFLASSFKLHLVGWPSLDYS
jgi:hypothetical protein